MTTVNHPILGQGTVVSQSEDKVTVDFNGTEKTLITKFSKLTNIDGTPFYTEEPKPVGKFKKTKKQKEVKVLSADEKKALDIQTWKEIALSINEKWDRNSTWKLAEQTIFSMKSNGNEMIQSIMMQDNLSEKQAYCLAKFGVESGQLN